MSQYYQEYRELRHGQSQLEQRLLKQGYTVEHCDHCNCSALVPIGETRQHDCQEKQEKHASGSECHQLVWLTVHEAACTGCHWTRKRHRVDGRYQSGYTVRAIWKAAHTPR